MLVTALDDLHMIKFKQGWFTLIKYDYQVGEKKNEQPRIEMLEFVNKVRQDGDYGPFQGLQKPITWISQLDLKIENKFKQEFLQSQNQPHKYDEIIDSNQKTQNNQISQNQNSEKPKSQSKVALKKQRAALQNSSQLKNDGAKLSGGMLSLKKKINLKLGGDAINEEEKVENIGNPNSNSGSEKVRDLEIKEDEQLRQQLNQINEENIQINLDLQQDQPIASNLKEENYNIEKNNQNQQFRNTENEQKNKKLDNLVHTEQLKEEKKFERPLNFLKSKLFQKVDQQIQNQMNQNKQEINSLNQQNIEKQKLIDQQNQEKLQQKVWDLSYKINKLIKREYYQKLIEYSYNHRKQEFINRIMIYDRKQEINKLRKSFYCMKINYLRLQVLNNANDQFQIKIKNARQLLNTILKSIWNKDQQFIKKQQYFKNWLKHTIQLKSIKDKSDSLKQMQDSQSQKIEDSTQTFLTDQVYLHVNTINILQNQENTYLKEIELEEMQNQEQIEENNGLSKLAVNKSKFYALLLSKLEFIAKYQMLGGFIAIQVVSSKDSIGSQSIESSINHLSKIRPNIIYLRKVKSSLEGKPNITLQSYQARKQSAIQGSLATADILKQSQVSIDNGSGKVIKLKSQQIIQDSYQNIPDRNQDNQNNIYSFNVNQSDKKSQNEFEYQQIETTESDYKQSNNQIQNFQVIESQNRSNLSIRPSDHKQLNQQFQEQFLNQLEGQNLQKIEKLNLDFSGQKVTELQNKIKRVQIRSKGPSNDSDTQYLLQIEKLISENIGLLKLFKNIKISDDKQIHQNSQVYQEILSPQDVEQKINENKAKVIAILKLINFRIKNKCLQLNLNGILEKQESSKVYFCWSKWVTVTKQDKIQQTILKINYRQHQIMKQSINLMLAIYSKNNNLSNYFNQWHKQVIINNYQIKNPQQTYAQNMLQIQSQKDEVENMKNQKLSNQQYHQAHSASLTFQEQKVFYKMSSFMRIKHILLKHFIQKGTVLQKYIDMLKYLAKEQNRIFNSSNQYNNIISMNGQRRRQNGTFSSQQKQVNQHSQHGYMSKRAQEEQSLIEENVTKIIKVIFHIVFNKWLVYAFKMNKDIKHPKDKSIQKLFMTIDNLLNRSKLFSFTQVHHYSLYVYQASSLNLNQPNPILNQPQNQVKLFQSRGSIQDKLQRINFSVFIIKNILKRSNYKLLNNQFHKWKQNCLIIEWRMNQSIQEVGLNPFGPVDSQDDGVKRSDALEQILENIRDNDLNHLKKNGILNDQNLHKQQIKQMVTDFKNAKNSEAVRQFFENYYTPKSAAIQQKLQKPWEIKLQRDTLKQVSIYRGAIRSEQLLTKQYMPTQIDKTFKPLLNINFNRIKMSNCFSKWRKVIYLERNLVGYKEKKQFMKIISRIQTRNVVKKFIYWKYMKVADDPYPTQCEQIDQQVLNTLSIVGKELSIQQKNLRYIYKDQVKKKVINKMFNFMQKQNPIRESFKIWKQQVIQIVQSKYEIEASLDEKNELQQQYELISIQNKQIKEERLQSILNCTDCDTCREMQKSKLDELSEITFNEKNYRILANLIGVNGIKSLLGEQNNVDIIFYNKSNSTPISIQSSSQDNSFVRLIEKVKSQGSLNYQKSNNDLSIKSKYGQYHNQPYRKQ